MTFRCCDCEWETEEPGDVPALTGGNDRLAPGDIVPYGECPQCGCAVHEVTESADAELLETLARIADEGNDALQAYWPSLDAVLNETVMGSLQKALDALERITALCEQA